MKQHVYLQNTTVDVSGTFWDLTAIPQGATFAQRIGAQAHISNLGFKLRFLCADTTNAVRLIILRWIPSDTSDVPNVGELLADASNPLLSPVLAYKPSRFAVLFDRLYALTTTGSNYITVDSVHLGDQGLVQFDIGANTGSRHIYAYAVSDSNAASHPGVLLYSDVLFYD